MINSRAIVVIATVIIFFIALAVKLFDVQILKSEELRYYAERQQTKLEKIKADRGLIYDRNNVLLAYNRNDVSFYLDLRMARQSVREEIASKFAGVFGKSKKHYFKLMEGKPRTICIEKKVSGSQADELRNYRAVGLFYQEDPTRVYQYERLGSHVLGFVNNENTGVNGIESFFESELNGEDGEMLVEKSAIGDMLTIAEEETKPSIPGENVFLTIDKSYQSILEEELRTGVEAYGAQSAIGIMMNPNNGEVLALANIGDYDPNEYWKFDDASRRNAALTDTYEPGSTFKTITLAALFDQHLAKEEENVFAENGRYRFKNVYINDSHSSGMLTVKGVMEQSSNIGMAKLVQRIDNEILYKYFRGFGFGNYTSINIPGEAKGTLKKPTQWGQLTKTFMSFGYEISVTPIQLVSAYSALVNGGVLYQPQLIKKRMKGSSVTFENEPIQVRRVISEETSERVKKIMQSIVENGTAKNAKLEFISVGGKTGTSQKLIEGRYSRQHYNSSFIGFFPVNKPEVICLILVNSPQVGRYGGLVAAPIFKNVASRIVKSDPDLLEKRIQEKYESTTNFTIAAVKEEAEEIKNVTAAIEFTKPKIISPDKMPDLTNASVRDAMLVLNQLGVKYKVNGSGRIVSQSISAGEKIKKNITCTLTCEEVVVSGASVY